MKPYSEYKDSDVSWLGEVPEHWEIKRSKSVLRSIDIRSEEGSEELLSVSEKNGVALRKNTNVTMFQAASYVGYKLCWPKDLVINSLWAWMTGLGFSNYHGIISTAYSVFRIWAPEKFDHCYGNYSLRSKAYNWEFKVRSKGIWRSRYQLSDASFLSMPLLLPPIKEQTQIARYLDWQTVKINKFIKNKKKLIALLKEQKQNIINEAVTKGLNPDVPMKNRGVDWLGDIPEHWKVRKFKYISKFYSGGTPSKANDQFWKGDIPWVSPKDMKSKYITDSVDHITTEAVDNSSTSIVDKSNLLMVVRSGILRRTIPIGIVKKRVTFNQDIRAIVLNHNLMFSEFLYELINGCEKKLLDEWLKVGATVESIEYEYMANTYFPLPSLTEQQTIVTHIEKENALIDKTISRAEKEIELIQEYRTRLVSDVVTGKVDVRSIEIPDFEPIEENLEKIEDEETEEELIAEGMEE